MTHPLRPQRTRQDFEVGDKALVCDERGRIVGRVVIASDRLRDNEIGYFYQCREEWPGRGDVDCRAGELLACDDAWRPLAEQPPELAAPDHRRVASADYGQGRVYAPEPYKRHVVGQHPVMEKFERVNAQPPANVPMDESGLSGDQRARLAEAARLAASKGRDGVHDRREARRMMNELQQELAGQQEQQAIDRGQVETIAAARRRGETIEVAHGRIRNLDRDGLESLLRSNTIDRIDFTAGMKYRELFEAALVSTRLTSSYGESTGGAAPDPERERLVRLRRLEKDQALTEIERFVRSQVRSPRAITALRLVAGEGRMVSHFSKGAGRAKNIEALKAALDVLAIRWGLT